MEKWVWYWILENFVYWYLVKPIPENPDDTSGSIDPEDYALLPDVVKDFPHIPFSTLASKKGIYWNIFWIFFFCFRGR
jgi:hypothetical protein